MLGAFISRFARHRGGNTAMLFALCIIPIVFLSGMALDFSAATSKRLQLNAAADSAALSAVTPAAMTQTNTEVQTTASNFFQAQASAIPGLTPQSPTPTINVVQNGSVRTVTVSYTANSVNAFPNVLGMLTDTPEATWTISGSSTASSTGLPNIDFYLLLDNSPSMDIAATTAGINTMVTNTSAQGGCAFACHESNSSADGLGNPGGVDNYTLAQNLGVVTRIQNMASATQALMDTASTTEGGNSAYRMAIYTFNATGLSTIHPLSADLSSGKADAKKIDVLEVCQNNYLTCGNDNNDTDTNFETAMSGVNQIMPNPGTGAFGSSPQEVLFIVSDGVDDETNTSCSQTLTGSRCQQPFDTSWCTTVKNRGIRVAVL